MTPLSAQQSIHPVYFPRNQRMPTMPANTETVNQADQICLTA